MTTDGSTAPAPSIAEMLQPIREALLAPGSAYETVPEDVRGETMPVFRHRVRSLRELLLGSQRFAERTYLVEDEVRIDFAEHLQMVDALASALQHSYGIRPGDRVAILAANRWEWIVAFWAAASEGGVPCAFNSYWTADEIGHAVALAEPSVLVVDAARRARLEDADVDVPVIAVETDLPALLEAHAGQHARSGRSDRGRSRRADLHQRHHRPTQGGDRHRPVDRGVRPAQHLQRGPGCGRHGRGGARGGGAGSHQ